MEKILKIFILSAVVFLPSSLFAATLNFYSNSASYEVGDTFAVNVNVSSPDKSLNAVSGTVNFPGDKLQVLSVSKTGSILNFWVEEPSYSNAQAFVKFEGVALNPGFIGASGRVVAITFKVKSIGSASLTFTGASILANDGKGTNIITAAPPTTLSFKEAKPVPVVEPEPAPVKEAMPAEVKPLPLETAVSTSTLEEKPIVKDLDNEVFIKYWNLVTNYLSIIIIIILILSFIIASIIYSFYRLRRFKNKVYKKFHTTERAIHHDFDVLKEELENYIDRLEDVEKKRDLTKEEKMFMRNFKKYISMVEEDIEGKLDSIEKDMEG